ncbi:hypothetical protein SUGI_0872650 [Cryptomeria japonica]|uniref:auxin-induced protein 15A-like n=1 Tax=Cryptomeria japonica TaxID=3369 RepID=UPI002414CEC8|nr:auxin-induced protein 15A-like [Cryptomeria japonica]GLJ42141.1 hypothetical protein SUGI_0872650 [Cryptomeria japonica]
MKSLAKQLQKLGQKTQIRKSSVWLRCGRKSMESSSAPRGCLPIYVGNEGYRFIVDIHFLSHPLFEELLQLSAEELGYSHKGGLKVACSIRLFEHLLRLINTRNPAAHYLQISDLLQQFSC